MAYSAKDIKHLDIIEAIRLRPGMYVGGKNEKGLHHLVWEVIDNAVDEALAGHAKNIKVFYDKKKHIIRVEDDGRGIPVDKHPKEKIPVIYMIFEKAHTGGKFDKNAYQVSAGLHGVGVKAVNALSERLDVWVCRDGKKYHVAYEKGKRVTDLEVVDKCDNTGTIIEFKPDKEIFGNLKIEEERIKERLQKLALALPEGVTIEFYVNDKKALTVTSKTPEQLLKESGAKKIWAIERKRRNKEGITYQIVFGYSDEMDDPQYFLFVNTIPVLPESTFAKDFFKALKSAVKAKLKKDLPDSALKWGLRLYINLLAEDVEFSSQTKEIFSKKLKTFAPEVEKELKKLMPELKPFITERASKYHSLRRKKVSKKEGLDVKFAMPGKFADASNKHDVEVFIVEGDSAGGSAKQARNRKTQAILALKGKPLNVLKETNEKKIHNNEEMKALFRVVDNPKYSKVIIMTDADEDGYHIRALLLGFFYKYAREHIRNGKIYIAIPPLYRLRTNKRDLYVYTKEELERIINQLSESEKKQMVIYRFKGLGEMNPEQLKETAMDPKTRRLMQVKLEDTSQLEDALELLTNRIDISEFINRASQEVDTFLERFLKE